MIVLSFDVGINNLAYAVIKKTKRTFRLLMWEKIGLMEDINVKHQCCGIMKNGKVCNKIASQILPIKNKAFCKNHVDQYNEYYNESDIFDSFTLCTNGSKCDKCKTSSKYTNVNGENFCTAHYKANIKKINKIEGLQKIKKVKIRAADMENLHVRLLKELDQRLPQFREIGVDTIAIENQPGLKNPRMKGIMHGIQTYFMIRGYLDDSFIKNIRLVNPCNKLSMGNDKELQISAVKNYKLTKSLGIQITINILTNSKSKHMLDILNKTKKKDDLCDAFLQGLYFLSKSKN